MTGLYRTDTEALDECLRLMFPDLDADDFRTDGGNINMPKVRSLWAERAIAPSWDYCWLVELFHRGDAGPSLGRYHTGFTDLNNQSRSTFHAHEAKRYTKDEAVRIAKELNVHMMACEWRAVEHGFLRSSSGISGVQTPFKCAVDGASTLCQSCKPEGRCRAPSGVSASPGETFSGKVLMAPGQKGKAP
jgi:hypothetical protein